MKAIVNSFLIAFSIYFKIPVPKVKHTKENMKYVLCFFPLLGIVVGVLVYAFSMFVQLFGLGQICFALIGTVIPILVTGGIHMNGFLNTIDALHSHEKKEKKLEIMKDPHVGVFGIIAAAAYFMLYAGGLVLILQEKQLLLLVFGYVFSCIMSAMAIVWFSPAKKDGTLFTLSSSAHKSVVKVILILLIVLASLICITISPIMGVLEVLLCFWIWTYYYYMSKREFGGITGDLAGYFISLCELGVVLYLGIFGRIFL